MIGRIVGFLVGAAIAFTGYGMLQPAPFAKYFDFTKLSLGPFVEYKTVVCWLIVAFGLAVILAAVQRSSGLGGAPRRKRKAPAASAPAQLALEPEPIAETHEEPLHEPEPRAHQIHTPEPSY